MTELEEFESWCDDLEAWERYRNEIIRKDLSHPYQ